MTAFADLMMITIDFIIITDIMSRAQQFPRHKMAQRHSSQSLRTYISAIVYSTPSRTQAQQPREMILGFQLYNDIEAS